jgi:hypothetical protein
MFNNKSMQILNLTIQPNTWIPVQGKKPGTHTIHRFPSVSICPPASPFPGFGNDPGYTVKADAELRCELCGGDAAHIKRNNLGANLAGQSELLANIEMLQGCLNGRPTNSKRFTHFCCAHSAINKHCSQFRFANTTQEIDSSVGHALRFSQSHERKSI